MKRAANNNRLRTGFAAAALLALLPALSGAADAPTSTLTGTFVFVLTLSLGKAVPAGTLVSVIAGTGANSVEGEQFATVKTSFNRTGDKQTVTLTLPYRWSLGPGNIFATMSVFAAGASAFAQIKIPAPKNGAKTEIDQPFTL